jgi:hypothetical protein
LQCGPLRGWAKIVGSVDLASIIIREVASRNPIDGSQKSTDMPKSAGETGAASPKSI